jgi:hypothetical protein
LKGHKLSSVRNSIPTCLDEEKVLRVKAVKESGGVYVYSVTCLEVGETILTLTVGNRKSDTLPMPVRQTSAIKVDDSFGTN